MGNSEKLYVPKEALETKVRKLGLSEDPLWLWIKFKQQRCFQNFVKHLTQSI